MEMKKNMRLLRLENISETKNNRQNIDEKISEAKNHRQNTEEQLTPLGKIREKDMQVKERDTEIQLFCNRNQTPYTGDFIWYYGRK